MAVSVFKAALLPRFNFPSTEYWFRGNMNSLTLLAVFALGVMFTCFVSMLTLYIQKEIGLQETERITEDLIANRRKILEKSQKFVLVPDESHLSVGSDTELSVDPAVYVSTAETSEKKNSKDANVLEALGALHAAIEMHKSGKHSKAMKLFSHALALNPEHPDILNHYGEFLEETERNLLDADYHYSRALTFSPNHMRALENHQRTSPIVDELDNNLLKRIDQKRDDLLNTPDSSSGLRRIKKEAYFQYIYHTLGIEGNTMSLAQTRTIVETRMAVGGKSIMEHNEVLGLDAALKYINSTLVHRIGAITFEDILEIHRRVLGFVDLFEGGRLRSTQVFVGNHIPPGPSEVQLLMKDFVRWLNSAESLSQHPIRFAALAHYKLVYIHPFSDGNGRTSRLLMNLILMQSGYPPVIIRKQDRAKYYDYLQQANEGDVRPFIRFIAHCAEHTLDVYLWATTEHRTSIAELAQEGQEDDGKTIIVDQQNCCVGG
ncbi:protein adenylyltransferase Fic-like [Daphnia pulicaria]|uniref:protein adenylyltransferase Fic-like n=1 Tax=Daphnia pulicaria TaxID=35523 RepID=UPI001EEB136A|nr:protein adenylyltransferase Fic-like [Daphnia pulicaria]